MITQLSLLPIQPPRRMLWPWLYDAMSYFDHGDGPGSNRVERLQPSSMRHGGVVQLRLLLLSGKSEPACGATEVTP